jgi:hypothetical protein
MKKITLLLFLFMFVSINCTDDEEPLLSHVYGWAYKTSDSTGINGLILKIRDINPHDLEVLRNRTLTTQTKDSLPGYFEIDSVCYGTTKIQGTTYVTMFIDSVDNPTWSDTAWYPNLRGPVDTVIIYLGN